MEGFVNDDGLGQVRLAERVEVEASTDEHDVGSRCCCSQYTRGRAASFVKSVIEEHLAQVVRGRHAGRLEIAAQVLARRVRELVEEAGAAGLGEPPGGPHHSSLYLRPHGVSPRIEEKVGAAGGCGLYGPVGTALDYGWSVVKLRFGDGVLDTDTRELQRAGTRVDLTPKAYELLELLLSERPKAVSKAQIRDRLWPETFVSDVTLTTLAFEVRRAIGDDARCPRHLRTVRKYGYAFAAEHVQAELVPCRSSLCAAC